MIDFDKYLMRHGEHWVQDIVERIEQAEGICPGRCISLEARWAIVMAIPYAPEQPRQIAHAA